MLLSTGLVGSVLLQWPGVPLTPGHRCGWILPPGAVGTQTPGAQSVPGWHGLLHGPFPSLASSLDDPEQSCQGHLCEAVRRDSHDRLVVHARHFILRSANGYHILRTLR